MDDPRPPRRIRDPDLLRRRAADPYRECALRDDVHPDTRLGPGATRLSEHHILKHPRDDVAANLVTLCGDGTTGCHGRIEAADALYRAALAEHLERERPDAIAYLCERLGGAVAAADWLRRLSSLRVP